MAQDRVNNDLVVSGNLIALGGFQPPAGSITDAMINAAANINDGKIIHRTVAETVASVQPGTSQLEERTHNTVVLVDHDIAMVWAPYVFCFDGVPHHEGTNIFSFVKQPDGRWLISGLTDNGRTLAG